MTHDQWIDLVIDRLEGIPTQGERRFHPVVIEQFITIVRDQIMCELDMKGLFNPDGYTKEFSPVSILHDTISDYSIIPCKLVPLSDIQDSIREISGTGNQMKYVPLKSEDVKILSDTDAGDVSDMITYTLVQNSNGLLVRYGTNQTLPVNVVMRIVASFDSYGATEQVRIPAQPEKFIEMVVNFAQGTPKVDLKNNNSDINGYQPTKNS
jgi:hypothetical protein